MTAYTLKTETVKCSAGERGFDSRYRRLPSSLDERRPAAKQVKSVFVRLETAVELLLPTRPALHGNTRSNRNPVC